MSGRLDPVDQRARRWSTEDRIIRYARHMVEDHDLPHAYVARLESAALHGDEDAFMSATRELLQAIEESR